jgi:hypothetical protein
VRYQLNYQQLSKGAARAQDVGDTVEIDIQADGHVVKTAAERFRFLAESVQLDLLGV